MFESIKKTAIEFLKKTENKRHIMFHLERDKEISILINQNDEDFEGLGQLRDKNERGVGEASSIFNGDSELDVIKKILDSLLGYNAKKENR